MADALRTIGYQVWRDDELPAHGSYAEAITERLNAAKSVVVVWSADAVKSQWVRSEANRAREQGKLVQVRVDDTTLPMPFDQIECADLRGWHGDAGVPGWRKVVASVGDLVGMTAPDRQSVQRPAPTSPTHDKKPPPLQPFGGIAFWRRFHVRTSAMYGGVVFFILLVMAIVFYRVGVQHQVEALQSRLRTAVITLSHEIRPESVLALNVASDRDKPEYEELVALFQRISADEPQFVSIYVLRSTDQPFVLAFAADYVIPGRTEPADVGEEYDSRQSPGILDAFTQPTVGEEFTVDRWGTVLSGYAPIRTASGQSIAVVGVDISEEDVAELKSDVLLATLGVFGFAGACIAFVAWVIGGNIRKPLARITNATNEIAAGKLETRVSIHRDDEFGVLGRHLDEMAAGLGEREIIRETFGRFVSEDVARHALSSHDGASIGGEERIVTLLTAKLANYPEISEPLSAADVVRLLNAYFGHMVEIIDRHHGCVIEFSGDTILCLFGAPEPRANHAELAVQCAIEMQAEMERANRTWEHAETKLWHGQGTNRLRICLGIHTGAVIAGNIGARSRVKYTAIGEPLNVVARVEHLNAELKTGTLLTEDTLVRLPAELRTHTEPVGDYPIVRRGRTVTVHAVH